MLQIEINFSNETILYKTIDDVQKYPNEQRYRLDSITAFSAEVIGWWAEYDGDEININYK